MKQIIKNLLDNYVLVYLDKLLKRPNVVNGLIKRTEKQIAKAKDYVFGVYGVTNKRVIKKGGNFIAFLPVGEQQNEGFERMWCVSENGVCNQIETIFNYYVYLVNNSLASESIQELVKIFRYFGLIKGDKCLLDTAYVAVGSGTTKRGNYYSRVCDFVRHYGLVPKGSWPSYTTWSQLYYTRGGKWINGNRVPPELLGRGKKLVRFIDITYEWIRRQDLETIVEMGVPGTSCYAWGRRDNNGIYQRTSYRDNHAILKPAPAKTNYKEIGDSYKPFLKKLALDYPLGVGMLLSFGLKEPFNVFDVEGIKTFKDKHGWDYIILVEDFSPEFTRGMYKVNRDNLEKISLSTAVDEWVKSLKAEDRIEGVNAKTFSELIT